TSFIEALVVFLTATVKTLNGLPESGSSRIESLRPCVECVQFLNCFGFLAAWSKALRSDATTSDLLSVAGPTTALPSAGGLIRLSFTSFGLSPLIDVGA